MKLGAPQGETLVRKAYLTPRRRENLLLALYLVLILWLNAYICRQVFFIDFTGQTNSMHGFWIAIANLSAKNWLKPAWWPYWYNGIPFEYTYAPLVPGITKAIALLSGFSTGRAFQIVSGGVYCLGPISLFLMARELTGRPGWSFIAAIIYSLSSASELLLPDVGFSLSHILGARRFYISFVWDEVPHQLGVAFICLAILFLSRALRDGSFRSYFRAGLFISLALLASAFGATAFLLLGGCLLATFPAKLSRARNLGRVFVCGLLAWIAMCPFLPPSLILTIRSDARLFPNTAWSAGSWLALALVICGGCVAWFVSRNWRPWYLRFFLLLAWTTFAIPGLDKMRGLHFLPQATRYKVELEVALVLLIVFAAAYLIDRLPKTARIALAIALLYPVWYQTVSFRRYSKAAVHAVDMTGTIEYKVAKWTESNLPGRRVVAPGSISFWLNAFSSTPQFSGGAFTTAPNVVLLRGSWDLKSDPETRIPAIWYEAWGVDAVVVAGTDSPEFWKPRPPGHQFDGVFPLLWEQQDTRIYAVPHRVRSLAHAIPREAVVSKAPASLSDTAQMERYIAAVESVDVLPATFKWLGDSRARIHAILGANQVLSVQETYNAGWKATSYGHPVAITKDALGQMILTPAQPGEYNIDLVYDGGWEAILCRAASVVVLVAVIILFLASRGSRYITLILRNGMERRPSPG